MTKGILPSLAPEDSESVEESTSNKKEDKQESLSNAERFKGIMLVR